MLCSRCSLCRSFEIGTSAKRIAGSGICMTRKQCAKESLPGWVCMAEESNVICRVRSLTTWENNQKICFSLSLSLCLKTQRFSQWEYSFRQIDMDLGSSKNNIVNKVCDNWHMPSIFGIKIHFAKYSLHRRGKSLSARILSLSFSSTWCVY